MNMIKIDKEVTEVRNRKRYLLGIDYEGTKHWLKEPSWDCGWYWGFGYIETKYNHSHWDSAIVGNIDDKGNYTHHLNENPIFKKTVLDNNESWKLAELMKSFYILKNTAGLLKDGCAGVADNLAEKVIIDERFRNKINKIILPEIFKKIDKLLS